MYTYDEKRNLEQLLALAPMARCIFALSAATRLLPSYRRFNGRTGLGSPDRLEEISHQIWISFASSQNPELLQSMLDEAEALIPSEDQSWDEETQPYAEDASAALAYSAKTRLTGDAQEAAWAGRRAFEAIYYFVDKEISNRLPSDERMALALAHPLVQEELARQERDLQQLAIWEEQGLPPASLTRFRILAERDASSFFGDS